MIPPVCLENAVSGRTQEGVYLDAGYNTIVPARTTQEEAMLRRRFLRGIMVTTVGFGLALMTNVASAQVSPHVAEALNHAKQAVEHGKMGHAPVLTQHAEEAMKHLEMARKDGANPHLDAAAKGLNDAITHGKMGHADVATKGAEEGVKHLEMIK